jgi:TolA-binding protein
MKLTKKIIQYLDGELKGQELLNFKTQIQNNEELSKLIILHKEINESILDEETFEFRRKLSQLYSSYKDKQKDPVKYKINRFAEYAAAASILFLLSFGVYKFFIANNSPENIYSTNYYPYDTDVITRSNENNNDGLNKAIYLYQKKEYESAYDIFNNYLQNNNNIPIANFYFGITAMELKNYNTAIHHLQFVKKDTTNLYRNHASWYLSLCYLEMEKIDLAKRELNELVHSGSQYKLKARKILKKLN